MNNTTSNRVFKTLLMLNRDGNEVFVAVVTADKSKMNKIFSEGRAIAKFLALPYLKERMFKWIVENWSIEDYFNDLNRNAQVRLTRLLYRRMNEFPEVASVAEKLQKLLEVLYSAEEAFTIPECRDLVPMMWDLELHGTAFAARQCQFHGPQEFKKLLEESGAKEYVLHGMWDMPEGHKKILKG